MTCALHGSVWCTCSRKPYPSMSEPMPFRARRWRPVRAPPPLETEMDAVTRQTDGQTALAVERMCAPREPKTILLAIQPASPPTLGATLESLAYWHVRLLAVGLAEVGARGLAREVKPARESEQPAVIKRLSYVAPAVWSGDAAWRMLTSDNPRGTKTS